MKTIVIIIGYDSDASLSLAARALSDRFDRVEVATFDDPAESIQAALGDIDPGSGMVVLPYLLEQDATCLKTLESAIAQIKSTRSDLDVRLGPPVGYDPRLLDILEDRVEAATNESRTDRHVPIITVERQDGSSRAFTTEELMSLPDRLDDIGRLVPDRSGEAVSVKALLAAASVGDTETVATFKSGETFSADVELGIARENGWLVFRLDGHPLPARYGGPVRLFIPGLDDRCANVKSVDRLIVK